MGPYCQFCGTRCFTVIPATIPEHIIEAYGQANIAATCKKGKAHERELIGHSYDDFKDIDLYLPDVVLTIRKLEQEART